MAIGKITIRWAEPSSPLLIHTPIAVYGSDGGNEHAMSGGNDIVDIEGIGSTDPGDAGSLLGRRCR